MAHASAIRLLSARPHRVGRAAWLGTMMIAALGSASGCAQVLGIPTDPELVPPPLEEPPARLVDAPTGPAAAPADDRGSGGTAATLDGATADGVVPPSDVTGIDGSGAPDEPGATPARTPPADAGAPAAGALDAGPGDVGIAPDGGAPPQPGAECPAALGRVPVDVMFIVDNTGSMVVVNAQLERALPAFAERLDDVLVDYRLIVLSRHREAARGTSEQVDASLCVAAPLGGLEACPSAAPALGERFFHYAIPIGATNSFSQALATVSQPDPFGLVVGGWSEWLRPGARKILIEISDANSALSNADFVGALAAAVPSHFAADVANPGFVFHSILGMQRKADELDVYAPDEPIQPALCAGVGNDPLNAGESYQALSRATGGLRQSICPASAIPIRLQVLAADIIARSVVTCP